MFITLAAVIICLTGKLGEPVDGLVSIHTRVLNSDGKPAAGASFFLLCDQDDEEMVAATGKADSAGAVVLRHRLKKGEKPATFLVRSDSQALYFRSLDPDTVVPETIHLKSGVTVKIALYLPNGAPAPHLTVIPKIIHSSSPREPGPIVSFPTELGAAFGVKTDSRGECEFRGMPDGQSLRIEVLDDRFEHLDYHTAIHLSQKQSKPAAVHLKVGASISGRVTQNGRPVPGVRVNAEGIPETGWGDGKSGPNGTFRITGLSPGSYNVGLDLKPPMSEAWTGRAKEVAVTTGEAKAGIELRLEKGSVVSGTVSDESGRPVKDVPIGIYGPARPQTTGWVQSTRTDEAGHYHMRVPPGNEFIYVMQEGGPSKTIHISNNENPRVDFQVATPKPDVTLKGRVLGPDGKPVPNASVEVLLDVPLNDGPGLGLLQLTADSKGTFRFVKPGAARGAAILAHTQSLATPQEVPVEEGKDVLVTLKPRQMASASGLVTDDYGKPVPGANVQVSIFAGQQILPCRTERAGPDGKFVAKALYPGRTYFFYITAPGYGPAQLDNVMPLADESLHLKHSYLARADSFMAGVVKDEKGAPVIGATVGIENMPRPPVTTDTAGRFRIERVPKGPQRVYAQRGSWFANSELEAGKKGQVIVLSTRNAASANAVSADEIPATPPDSQVGVGGTAVEFEASTWFNTKPLQMSQLRGKIVLLDFWGISCRPCVAALPALERIAKSYGGRQVVVIGLHDSTGTPKQLTAFAKKAGLTYPLLIDRPDKDSFGKTASKYRIGGTPSIVLIDRTGKVVAMPNSPGRAAEMIEHLLKQPN